MENSNPKKFTWSSVITTLKENRKSLHHLWLIHVALYILALSFGIGILLIVMGILFATRRIFIYWAPARAWTIRVFDLKLPEQNLQNTSLINQRFIFIYHFILFLLHAGMGAFVIWAGLTILFREGFLGQNLIYIIIKNSK
jgi:hypothetical protein